MARSLGRPKTLTTFPRISLSTKIQSSNPQPSTDHGVNDPSNIDAGTFNSESFYTSLIDKSTSTRHLNQIYSRIIATGFQYNGFIVTKLIHISSNLGDVSYARKLFDEFPEPYVFLWNAIIRGYSKQNIFKEAIMLYTQMQNAGVRPDCFTLPHVLKSCGGAAALEVTRAVHGQIFRHGFESDVFVQNGVVAVYSKCSKIDKARIVFEGLNNSHRTIVSWTSIISGYAQNSQPIEALRIFKTMRSYDLQPDWITLVSIISAYTDIEDLQQGKSSHSFVIKIGLEFEPDIRIALTTLYSKCGHVIIAKSLFDEIKIPNVIMWNAMISGFAKNGFCNEAITLFQKMLQSKKLKPNSVTISSTILACANLGSLQEARKMGEYISKTEYKSDVFVNTALIDMYAKCGSLELSRKTFDQTNPKDIVVWSAMIVGYGIHGKAQEALNLFHSMKKSNVGPNDVTFIGLLTACNHAGLVDQGFQIFNSMKSDYNIAPRHQHYACVVDLLGRAGRLNKAYEFIKNMEIEPGVSIWGALLSASRIYRHVALGEYSAEKLFSLDPYNTGHYVQLSNLYASVSMWSGVARVRVLMKERRLNKNMGCSMIEVEGKMHVFRMGDRSHPRSGEIFEVHKRIDRRLKEAGFVADVESVLHDLSDEDMEESLWNHSERLAVAFGIISTPFGSTIRVIKNLRACVNCHAAIKLISRIEKREIVVRDANRFHHFKDGECSCGDYW